MVGNAPGVDVDGALAISFLVIWAKYIYEFWNKWMGGFLGVI